MEQMTSAPTKIWNKYVSPFLLNPVVQVIVSWLLVISIVFSINDIPIELQMFIKHPVTRFFITLLGLYVFTQNFIVSVISTVLLLAVYYFSIYIKYFVRR